MMDMFEYVFYIVSISFVIAILPVVSQYKCGINNGWFKTIKIKKFSFLFRAPMGDSVKDGLAWPLFIVQLFGYFLSFVGVISGLLGHLVFKISQERLLIFALMLVAFESVGYFILLLAIKLNYSIQRKK